MLTHFDDFRINLLIFFKGGDLNQNLSRMKNERKKIIINVSGQKFETKQNLFEKHPNTLLGSEQRELFYDKENDEYFFERDPDTFRYIFNYYLTGELHFPKKECFQRFEKALNFFGIDPNVIGDCCYEDFCVQKQEMLEKTDNYLENKSSEENNHDLRQKIWEVVENARGTKYALVFRVVICYFIVLSVVTNIYKPLPCRIQDYDEDYYKYLKCEEYSVRYFWLYSVCVVVFTVEYVFRLFAAPNRFDYARSFLGIIDVVAILPYYIGKVSFKC